MKRVRGTAVRVFGPALTGLLIWQAACAPAFATLGEAPTAVDSGRQQIKGQIRVTVAAGGYTVHELQTSTNTTVREFVSTDGKVFAVTWNGPALPDLQQTLGAYLPQYQSAASAPHAGHRHLAVEKPGLVIHSNGHMRSFSGYAYLPALLPTNFSADDIK